MGLDKSTSPPRKYAGYFMFVKRLKWREGGSTNTNKSELSSGEDDRLRSRCFSAVFVVRASAEKRKG